MKKFMTGTNIFAAALFCSLILMSAQNGAAQFTFHGDFDRSNFAAPNGYFVEPQNNFPADATNPARAASLFTGELNPDGTIIAGGRRENSYGGDFWLRKFTASGAPDTSFGGGTGYVRTVFETDFFGAGQNSLPAVLKRQADGKIVFGGICQAGQQTAQNSAPGTDFCLLRYNADGSIDTSFGGYSFVFGSANQQFTHNLPPGRVWIKSGTDDNGSLFGSFDIALRDMAIQPDGKIIVVGYSRSITNPYFQGNGIGRREGVIVRFNPDGRLDTSFGLNGSGIARFIPPNAGTISNPCYQTRQFYAVRLQPDGRIIAVGSDGGSSSSPCNEQSAFFVVTRWTANGTLETIRRLDNNTNQFTRERGVSALITNDGGKLLVSGSYQGNEALVRFNLSDLSVDTSFGINGVVSYSVGQNIPMFIKAIQTDGKILGFDDATNYPVFRLNPNGSPDNSFGNQTFFVGTGNPRGRADLPVFTVNNTAQIAVGHILLRPNGKFNVVGAGLGNFGGPNARGLVSQNVNFSRSGNYSDFTNDGNAELAVFRSNEGNWYQLNSSTNGFSAQNWGTSNDKLAPADYDGDGKTDFAVYCSGLWIILQSSNNQVRYFNFGTGEDLPRPGDFDGDGRADVSVFRPSNGFWYRLNSSDNSFQSVQFGQANDVPMISDFDGDGRTDFCVYRPTGGAWFILQSSDLQVQYRQFGLSTDIPLNGDFTGDGRADLAVYRPSNGFWYWASAATGDAAQNFNSVQFGTSTDTPVAADYDGDGRTDIAVYRGGDWYILRSSNGSFSATRFGLTADKPVPAAYLP